MCAASTCRSSGQSLCTANSLAVLPTLTLPAAALKGAVISNFMLLWTAGATSYVKVTVTNVITGCQTDFALNVQLTAYKQRAGKASSTFPKAVSVLLQFKQCFHLCKCSTFIVEKYLDQIYLIMKPCKLKQIHSECGADGHCFTLIQFAEEMKKKMLETVDGSGKISQFYTQYIQYRSTCICTNEPLHQVHLLNCLLTHNNQTVAWMQLSEFRHADLVRMA